MVKFRKEKRIHCSILFGLCMCSGGSFADGYRNPPPTAEGLGKSGAHSVFVDDASAVFYNPANLGLQTDKQSLVLGSSLARADNTFSPMPGVVIQSEADWNVLPNIFYSKPHGEDGLVFGLGVNMPYGQGVVWDPAKMMPPPPIGVRGPVPYEAEVISVNVNPTVGFKVFDGVYIGFGVDLLYSEITLNALYPTADPFAPVDAKAAGDGWGVGGNLGLTWLVGENQRLALTYRSRVDVHTKGDFSLGGNFSTKLQYPNMVGVGYGIQVMENLQVEALVEWLGWSVNDEQSLEIDGISTIQRNDWDDTVTATIGGSWIVNKALVLRAGYSFIPTPVPEETLTPLLIDTDRHIIGCGLGYFFGMHRFDFAYAHSIFEERTRVTGNMGSGVFDVDADLLNLTYSVAF